MVDNIQTIGFGKFIEKLEIYTIKLTIDCVNKFVFLKDILSYLFWFYLGNKNILIKLLAITILLMIFKILRRKKMPLPIPSSMFFTKETLQTDKLFGNDEIFKIKKLINENNKIREKFMLEKESIDDSFFKIVQMYLSMIQTN
jgi:hypothetical protein